MVLSAPMPALTAMLSGMRPGHWVKNAFVVIPVIFSGRLADPAALISGLQAAAAFCLQSSAGYLLNDVCDAARDRANPLKASRPVASGALSVRRALAGAAVLTIGAQAVTWGLPLAVRASLAAYLLLSGAYSLALKRVVAVDAFAIALGFVLRIVAGCAAIDVPVSGWVLSCGMALALLLALGKRRYEAVDALPGIYPAGVLDRMIAAVAAIAAFLYLFYALDPSVPANRGGVRLIWSVPLVAAGLVRYLHLVRGARRPAVSAIGLLRDRALLACVAGWTAAVVWAAYG